MDEQRRTATLLAAARQLETAAGDDALDLLDQLLGGILDRAGTRERLRTLPALDLAAAQPRDAVKVLLDPPAGGLPAVWAAIGRTVSREQLAAAEAVDATTRPAPDTHLFAKKPFHRDRTHPVRHLHHHRYHRRYSGQFTQPHFTDTHRGGHPHSRPAS